MTLIGKAVIERKKLNFHFWLTGIGMTLQYIQGHWKWYAWAKTNKYFNHAMFDIDHNNNA